MSHPPSQDAGKLNPDLVTRLREVCVDRGNTAAQASAVPAHTAGKGNKTKQSGFVKGVPRAEQL